MRKVIIVIEKIEDAETEEGKAYKAIMDKEGNAWRIKSGRGGTLEKKWDTLKENLAYELSVDTFKGYEYVADFVLVKDELQAEAAQKVAGKASGVSAQERGMWWKEVGKLIVADKLEEVFGEKDAPLIRRAYKLQAIASLEITAKRGNN